MGYAGVATFHGGPGVSRTAFYYDQAIPPRDWLVWAALLWDRVQVSGGLDDTLRMFPEYAAAHADASFLLQLMQETDICRTVPPTLARDQLSTEEQSGLDKYIQNASVNLDRIVAEGQAETGKRYFPTADDVLSVHSLANQILLPRKYIAAFPRLDFFFHDQPAFVASTQTKVGLVLEALESVVPMAPSTISVSRLQSFRADTVLQRSRFADAVGSALADFAEVSTEHDFISKLRFVKELLKEQLSLLESRYQQHRIETVKRVFGLTLAPPAALSALSSFLNVPIWQPAAIVAALSLAAADYLSTRDKNRAELRTAPWAYLLDLKRL